MGYFALVSTVFPASSKFNDFAFTRATWNVFKFMALASRRVSRGNKTHGIKFSYALRLTHNKALDRSAFQANQTVWYTSLLLIDPILPRSSRASTILRSCHLHSSLPFARVLRTFISFNQHFSARGNRARAFQGNGKCGFVKILCFTVQKKSD